MGKTFHESGRAKGNVVEDAVEEDDAVVEDTMVEDTVVEDAVVEDTVVEAELRWTKLWKGVQRKRKFCGRKLRLDLTVNVVIDTSAVNEHCCST